MDFRYTFVVAVMCLLVPVDAWLSRKRARPDRLQSIFKLSKTCQAGNLLQIHFDGGKTQAKCDGTSTTSSTTKFMIKDIRNKTCIQYTGKQGGSTSHYALKVIDRMTVTFMKERCNSSTADAFLFDEERQSPSSPRYYKHTLNNTSLYLGVNSNCNDDSLSLLYTNSSDRRCQFQWIL